MKGILNLGMSGQYKAQVLDADNNVKRETDWLNNIIVNGGLDKYLDAVSFSLNSCSVGTGTATPDATDVALGNSIGTSSSFSVGNIVYNTSIEPYYAERTITYNFTLGDIVGNITEVGVSHNTGLFSRALFLDGMGDPTAITVLADEQLRIFYKLRINAPVGDILGTVNGYNVVIRPANFNNATSGWDPLHSVFASSTSGLGLQARTGGLAAFTDTPPGSNLGSADSLNWTSYTAGTFTRTATVGYSTSVGNGTIGCFYFNNSLNRWQFSVDPSIVKTSDDILTLEITFSIARV